MRSESPCSNLEFSHPAVFTSKWDSVDQLGPMQATVVVGADMLVDIAKMMAVVVGKPVMASTEAARALDNLFEACRGFIVTILSLSFVVEAANRFLELELFCLFLVQVSNLPSCQLELNPASYFEDSARLAFLPPLRKGCLWVALHPI